MDSLSKQQLNVITETNLQLSLVEKEEGLHDLRDKLQQANDQAGKDMEDTITRKVEYEYTVRVYVYFVACVVPPWLCGSWCALALSSRCVH